MPSRRTSSASGKHVLIASCLALSACATSNVGEPVSGDVLNAVTPDRVPGLIRKANAGDLSAASTLVVYYGALAIENSAQKREWLKFGAERGDCNSIQILIEESVLKEDREEANALANKYRCNSDGEHETAK